MTRKNKCPTNYVDHTRGIYSRVYKVRGGTLSVFLTPGDQDGYRRGYKYSVTAHSRHGSVRLAMAYHYDAWTAAIRAHDYTVGL